MTTTGPEFITTVTQRIDALEARIQAMVMPDDGRPNRSLEASILAIETGCNKYLSMEYMDPYIDSKIKTAFELAVLTQNQTGGSSGQRENQTVL